MSHLPSRFWPCSPHSARGAVHLAAIAGASARDQDRATAALNLYTSCWHDSAKQIEAR